ncbi:MAG: right-handed parallel beta-helix repeat-containing protein [Halobacteriales archaeon]
MPPSDDDRVPEADTVSHSKGEGRQYPGGLESVRVTTTSDGCYRALTRNGETVEAPTSHAVLRAAVDRLDDGGAVGLTVGSYDIGATLEIDRNNVVIEGETRGTGAVGNFEGEGSGGTKLDVGSDLPAVAINTNTAKKHYGELRDLYLYGPGADGDAAGVVVEDCDQYQFERLFVQQYGTGLHLEGKSNAYNVIQCIFIENGDWHVEHRSSNKPQFYASKFLNTDGGGVIIRDVKKAEFDQCDFHGVAETALAFDGASHAVVGQCQFDQRTDTDVGAVGVDVRADAHHVRVADSQFQDWTMDGAVGVALSGDHSTVSDCSFDNVDTAIEVTGAHNRVDGCTFTDVRRAVVDRGTRTLLDGRGENAGDPGETGQWHGHATYAYRHNATIYDTAGDCWYKPTPDGDWLPITRR